LSTYDSRDLGASVESVDLPVRSAIVLARLSLCACPFLDNTYLVQASEEDMVDSRARRRSAGDEIMGMQLCEAVAECDGWRGRPRFCISRAIIGGANGLGLSEEGPPRDYPCFDDVLPI